MQELAGMLDDIILKHSYFACDGVSTLQHLEHLFSKRNNEGMMHSRNVLALKQRTILRNYNIYHASSEPFAVLKGHVKLEYCFSVQGSRMFTQSPLVKSNKCTGPSTWLLITAQSIAGVQDLGHRCTMPHLLKVIMLL